VTDEEAGEWARGRVEGVRGRLPRPTTPAAQDAIYVYVTFLLFISPAVAVGGAAWVAFEFVGPPVAVLVGGVTATVYALFLSAVLVRAGIPPDA